jgi:hypothetical protein
MTGKLEHTRMQASRVVAILGHSGSAARWKGNQLPGGCRPCKRGLIWR